MPLTVDEKKTITKKKLAEKYGVDEKKVTFRLIPKLFIPFDWIKSIVIKQGESSDVNSEDEEQDGNSSSIAARRRPALLPPASVISTLGGAGLSSNLEELRKRVQEKILNLKSQRTSSKLHKKKQKLEKKPVKTLTQKSIIGSKEYIIHDHKDKREGHLTGQKRNRPDSGGEERSPPQQQPAAKTTSLPASGSVEFSKLLMINNSSTNPGTGVSGQLKAPPAPGTKVQRMKKLLEESEKKRARLEALSQQGELGQKKIMGEKWNDVLKTAAGEKTIIIGSGTSNTDQKIKKALKRREHKKSKSAQQWKERNDAVEAGKAAKIEKRETNIAKRKNKGLPTEVEVDSADTSATTGKKHRNNPYSEFFKKNNPVDVNSTDKELASKSNNRAGFEGKKGEFLNDHQKKGR
jgi:hypothetical protein